MPFSSPEPPGPPPVTVKAYLYWQLRAIRKQKLPTNIFFPQSLKELSLVRPLCENSPARMMTVDLLADEILFYRHF